MNNRYFVIIGALTAMLIGATAFATTDSAFAGGYKRYESIYSTGKRMR